MKSSLVPMLVVASLQLVACGGANATGPATSTTTTTSTTAGLSCTSPDAVTLSAQPAAMLRDLDAGRADALIARMSDDAIVLDLDENNKPVRYQGKADIARYFHSLTDMAKSQGLTFKTDLVKNECEAGGGFGVCVVEFDQTITQGGKAMGPFKFRGTVVAQKVGNEWRWVHWHGSMREAPKG